MALKLNVKCDVMLIFFFKQKTAYEMRISDWSSDVCSTDLAHGLLRGPGRRAREGTVSAQRADRRLFRGPARGRPDPARRGRWLAAQPQPRLHRPVARIPAYRLSLAAAAGAGSRRAGHRTAAGLSSEKRRVGKEGAKRVDAGGRRT